MSPVADLAVDQSAILDGIAAVVLGVPGLNDQAVYSAGGGTNQLVRDLPDNLADGGLPAVVVLGGPKEIIPGSWERTSWTVELSVWREMTPLGEMYRFFLDVEEPIREAFRKAPVNAIDPAVQSLLVTGVGRVERRQWPVSDTGPRFAVLPFELEVKVNRSVSYRPGAS